MNKSNKKYLGVDWGEKRIGLALADGETKLATPFKTVGTAADVEEIAKYEEIDVVVVGKPMSIANYESKITDEKYNKFIKNLEDKISAPIELVDERLSSKAADALAGDKKTKAGRDEIAAMLILQSYLDKI
ncbi:MAG: Holliday junction resolvase RuvX [bacterium]